MNMSIILLVIAYFFLVIRCTRHLLLDMEIHTNNCLTKIRCDYENLLEQKQKLYSQKMEMEEEALEIFTLYEITKEITKSLSEQAAFNIFKQKLQTHVRFDECHLLEPHACEAENFKNQDDHVLFALQGKEEKLG